jgi:predicted nucleic acid-binding protein
LDRVFLDANVLFSAAYRKDSRLRKLWSLSGIELLSSHYAVEEAKRNLLLTRPENLADLEFLVSGVTLSGAVDADPLTQEEPDVEPKDRPILAAAISMRATHLLTGDKLHFGHLFGRAVSSVVILTPSMYWRMREDCII